ncbi:MAG TPA: flagellar assembly protein FliW [Rhodocyclaceae bacterium]|nr:flagellar assembly protein FliW [Rhodocyclaceae bacterium]
MKIESPNFGSLDVDPAKLIEFPAGLPGFEDCKRFTLIEVDSPKAAAIAILQSADRPDVAFSVTIPDHFGLHYEFDLTSEEEEVLRAKRVEDIVVLLILRRDESARTSAAAAPVKANLTAPLVINAVSRRGIQKIIGRIGCDITLRPAA